MTISLSSGIGAGAGPTCSGFDLAEVIQAASLMNDNISYWCYFKITIGVELQWSLCDI